MQLVALLVAVSIAAPSLPPARSAPPQSRDPRRARLVAAARQHLGERFPGDCSGFVRRVFADARVPLPSGTGGRSATESMARSLARTRSPRPGDLAFFHRTYDRDGRGPRRNLFTHVALVESVKGPRLTLIHRGGAGVRRFRMNVARPADPRENAPLRRRRPGDAPAARALAGELLAGFASAVDGRPRAARSTPAAHRRPQAR